MHCAEIALTHTMLGSVAAAKTELDLRPIANWAGGWTGEGSQFGRPSDAVRTSAGVRGLAAAQHERRTVARRTARCLPPSARQTSTRQRGTRKK